MPSDIHPSRSTIARIPLSVAIGASLLLHAGLGLALGIQANRASNQSLDTRFSRFDTSENPEQRRVQLGNPDARTASLTWIGYEEFEEMWAPKSEIDQAQQSPEDPAAPSEEPLPTEQPSESTEPEPMESLTESPESDSPSEPAPAEADPAEELVASGPDAQLDPAQLMEMIEALEGLTADLPRLNPIPALVELQRRRTPPRDREDETTEANTDEPVEVRAENGQSPAKPPASGESGLNSDREADAAAVNPVKRDDLGKPLVAQGLSIRTVRPSFSNVTLATARPRNPVVQLDFRRNGIPLPPRIIRSSGHEQVDIQVRIALAQWRAEGEVLQKLPEPEDPENPAYISIKLEILL